MRIYTIRQNRGVTNLYRDNAYGTHEQRNYGIIVSDTSLRR